MDRVVSSTEGDSVTNPLHTQLGSLAQHIVLGERWRRAPWQREVMGTSVQACFVDSLAWMSAHTEIYCCRSSSSSAGDSASLRRILRGTLIGVPLTSATVLLPVALCSGEGTESVTHMSDIGRNQVPGTHPSIPVGVGGGG